MLVLKPKTLIERKRGSRDADDPVKDIQNAVKSLKARIKKLKKSTEPEDAALRKEHEELLKDILAIEEILDRVSYVGLKSESKS